MGWGFEMPMLVFDTVGGFNLVVYQLFLLRIIRALERHF
jgi:hypothetical protein